MLTVGDKFKAAVNGYTSLQNHMGRHDSEEYQAKLNTLIKEFILILGIVHNLGLFSDNEHLSEVAPNYIPFLNVDFYLGRLYTERSDKSSLDLAQNHYITYLVALDNYDVLNKSQKLRLRAFKHEENPSYDQLVSQLTNPTLKRQEKIENYRLEKELNEKLKIIQGYFDNDESFTGLDEEVVVKIFVDQLRLFSIQAFSALESIAMEKQVLKSRKVEEVPHQKDDLREKSREKPAPFEYTPKLERKTQVTDLVSRQGKILQPFTITSNRQDLKRKVFGTGQVLPSMSVDEYLEWELANGKMATEEVKVEKEGDTDDEDEELEKRQWDDWKDDNPKGAGNMGANIG